MIVIHAEFGNPWALIGRTIEFRERIPCCECENYDSYELCPHMIGPSDCPQKMYSITVETVAYEKHGARKVCIINDSYEFLEEEFERHDCSLIRRKGHPGWEGSRCRGYPEEECNKCVRYRFNGDEDW